MLCFVISKRDYDLSVKNRVKVEPNCVCIGSINSIDEAQILANALPCLTEVHIADNIYKRCYITCNV